MFIVTPNHPGCKYLRSKSQSRVIICEIVPFSPIALLLWTLFCCDQYDRHFNFLICPELINKGFFTEQHLIRQKSKIFATFSQGNAMNMFYQLNLYVVSRW